MRTLHINVRDTLLNNEKALLNRYINEHADSSSQSQTHDFTLFCSSGVINEYMVKKSDSTSKGLFQKYNIGNFSLHVLSNECVQVTYKLTLIDSHGRSTSSLRSSIWVRIKDIWKLNFHQVTDLNVL